MCVDADQNSIDEFRYFGAFLLLNMKRVLILLFLLLALTDCTHAQTLGLTAPPDVDTNYVTGSWETWSARVFTSRKTKQFAIRSNESDTKIRYMPSRIWVVGVGIAYKFILADLGFAIPIKGESTRRFDVQVSFRINDHVVDVGYRRYKGFNSRDNLGQKYDFRGDIRSQVFGFNYYRHFATRKVPLRGQASGMQVQKKSAGSFGYGGYWTWDQIKADSSLIPVQLNESFNGYAKAHFTSQFTFGVMGGYAFSLVLPKNLYFFAAALPGTGLNVSRVKAETTYNPPFVPNARLNVRSALGYLGPGKVYVILSGSVESTITNWGNKNRYSYTFGQLKLVVGYRFTSEIGFLERIAKRIEGMDFQ